MRQTKKWAEGNASINDGIAQSCLLGLAWGRIHSFPTSDLPKRVVPYPPRLRYLPSACFTNSRGVKPCSLKECEPTPSWHSENGKDGQSIREVGTSVLADMVMPKTRAKGLISGSSVAPSDGSKCQQRRWLTLAYTPTVPDFLNNNFGGPP